MCGDNFGVSCMGCKQDWSDRSTRGNVKHVYILAVCPYNVCDVLHCQLNMALDQACWKRQKEAFVTMWKRITKTQELWTNKWWYVLKWWLMG